MTELIASEQQLSPESIRSIRHRLGLSQAAFAVLLNERVPGLRTHQVTVARWEAGAMRPSSVSAYVIRDLMARTP